MKNFLIVARSFSDLHEEYISIIRDYIKAHGGMCILDLDTCADSSEEPITVADDVQCIITVGGDGTVVRVAQNVTNREVPIVGLNCGHLGYLCDMTVDNIEHCLDQLLNDNYKLDTRMMLEGDCSNDSGNHYRALNDIVVAPVAAGLYVLNLTVKVNGIQLYNHNCDGLIVATPTGSTAYNLSANGPIVSPHADCIILTPINPHTLNSRSIILASSDEVEVTIEARHDEDDPQANIVYDGTLRQTLKKGETLRIYRSNTTSHMVMLENVNFLERIRARMQEI
ncbi:MULTISPECIES: NAD(+)/NADH kinase [Pseudobutyrivibrio]|uniref:NAD kinase n=1 Tax=Pseudobutyrivibrio xylanivorans TaxID=185007 RepID=A0A1G5RUD6_PSEXY|nr:MULTISPECIES: NAD(+)/NADH kinase [Pseudobutyrivibrio]MDC7279605.1 NAD(+)/NADH kinase [Butyrivibrio fibrisolvens]SCZ77478.1 NAD+ kinase [Pseudobutyrivibrio xylanivorans]